MSKTLERGIKAYFILVATLMYYFINEQLNVGLAITFRHLFALLLFGSALLIFLFQPNVARGVVAVKDAFVYSMPLVVTTVVSLFIWFAETVDVGVITRGLSTSLIYTNMLSAALGVGALLYIFGERGVWYNLIAILLANLLMIATIILQNGLGVFLSEFITLIVTFAGTTGDVIIQAEIHELAFCLGAYLIYMLYRPKKSVPYLILLVITLFCFLAAFKRIAMIAIAIALFFGYILKFIARYNKKTAIRLVIFLSVVVIALLLAYVAAISVGVFEVLEKMGINTSGRVEIYDAVDEFYEFSPDFLGNGIGFVTYQLNDFIKMGVASVHNDFLQHYIDLGFFGYIIWLVAMTLVRVCYFGKRENAEGAIVAFILTLYLIIASSTDNTMNYPLLTGTLAILMTSNRFDERVREKETSIFGYVSAENKERKESLL